MYQSLPGFREWTPADMRRRSHIFQILRNTAARYFFEEFDGPVLEPLELYIDKSGDEVVDQLFWFEDKGKRKVALRPEMTPTLARMAGASASSLRKPARWFTLNEQYRFERPQKGRQRSFFQFNLDILGESGAGAEADVIACFIDALENCGLGPEDCKVRLSDRRLWACFLDCMGMASGNHPALLSLIDKVDRMSEEKMILGLQPYFGDAADDFLGRVNELRTLREGSDVSVFFQSLQSGQSGNAPWEDPLDSLSGLISQLEAMGMGDYVVLDLGIVRGLAYYTGPVFEIFEADGQGRALAGGGRYDDLVERLSGKKLEAVGGALGDVTLFDLLEKKGLLPELISKPDCYVLLGEGETRGYGLALARILRKAGYSVTYSLKGASFGKQMKEANRLGAEFLIIAGDKEASEETVQIKQMTTGRVENATATHLTDALRHLVENPELGESGEVGS